VLNFNLGHPLCALGNLYLLMLIGRAILSWFPIRPDSPIVPFVKFLNTVTEPIVAPFRRVIPPMGVFDISYIVAFFVVEIFVNVVLCAL
jgi:YggT family protein